MWKSKEIVSKIFYLEETEVEIIEIFKKYITI